MIPRLKLLLAALCAVNMTTCAMAEPIDDLIEAEMARGNVPGLAIAVVSKGRLIRAEGFGYANLEHHVPVHPDTLFKTGATGMQLTAAAIMLLVQDGKIGLDDPVHKYMPEVPRKWQPVTIRQLLNHTSGLPATPNGDFRADYSDKQLLDIIAGQDLNFPAGTRWRFSYAEYIVLGFVVKRVSGEYYADFLKRRVFAPLGMHTAQAIDELAIVPNRAAGYELRDGALRNAEWVSPTANSTADGSLYLSIGDYAAWATAISGRDILDAASWDEIGKPARLNDGAVCPYGFGWYLEAAGAQGAWWHSGSWQGFQTYALRYLGEDLTIAVFANGGSADVEGIARRVAAMIEPRLSRRPAAPLGDQEPQVTAKMRKLLDDIAAGQARYADFAAYAKLDFTELTAQYAQTLSTLGTPREIALFDTREQCGEKTYRYRARYERGLVEVRASFTANGRIGNLEIVPLSAWDAPL